ncbi:13667_t:CDS:10 [Entrophospora sp. SA101]|nr:13667_t:CDS:10 [Entrophospora sp. SA101]
MLRTVQEEINKLYFSEPISAMEFVNIDNEVSEEFSDAEIIETVHPSQNNEVAGDEDEGIEPEPSIPIPQVLSHDMHTRHGGLLAAGEISLAWSEINGNDRSWVEIHKKLIEANWPITSDIMVVWKEVVYDLLSRKDEHGQDVAVRAAKEIPMREFLTTLIFGNIIDDLCYRTSIFTISQNADGWIMRFLKKNEEYEDDSSTAKDENSDQDDVEQERILRKLIGLRKWSNQLLNCFVSYIKSAIAQSMIVIKFGATDNPDNVQVPKILKRLFKLLYYTMKICGYKTIVSDLEPTFYFMLLQDPKDYNGWETRYVLLIWLSLISMIPFDLKTVDSRTSTGSDKIPLVENMIRLSKFYLEATGKERDGAAILLSRLLTRCDMAEKYLNNYVQWERDEARNNKDVFTITGIFTSLCAIYKLGQRQSLLPTLETAWQCLFILEENQMFTNNALVRKMLVKLAQGFGLCYLKPKIASWNNLQTTSKPNIDPSNIQKSLKEEGEEDEEIPDHIEEIIEILLNGLKHKDTVVHWSAAKGLGRLSQCLPQELADDVIGSLFELFSENAYNEITC